jgi:hypothetical protein
MPPKEFGKIFPQDHYPNDEQPAGHQIIQGPDGINGEIQQVQDAIDSGDDEHRSQ